MTDLDPISDALEYGFYQEPGFDQEPSDLIRAGNSIGKTSHAYPVVLKRRVVQSWVVAWLAR